MASNIWEALQQQRGAQQAVAGQTAEVMQAASGKAATEQVGPAKTQQAIVGAQEAAATQASQVVGQASQQQQQQVLKWGAIQRSEEEAKAQVEQARLNAKQAAQTQADRLIQNYSSQWNDLSVQKRGQALEQVAFYSRLADDQYIEQIKAQAKIRGLEDNGKFKEAALAAANDDMIDLLRNNVKFQRLMTADDQKFQEELASINGFDAFQMAMSSLNTETTQKNYQRMAESSSSLVTKYLESKPTKTTTTPTAGEGG